MEILPTVTKVFPTLTEEERNQYLRTINRHYKPIKGRKISDLKPREVKRVMDRAIAHMQLTLCCRPTEICNILIQNVDFKRYKIILEDSKTHDCIFLVNMEDALYMPTIVEKALKDWIKIRKIITPIKPIK